MFLREPILPYMQMILKSGEKTNSIEDCIILNRDIDTLHSWAKENGMKFHPKNVRS